ncbi:MAG: hypothetical protein HY302_01320 [Opitutae bacterium]|nr:hypothetical protein [Opitutae bacterium]
MKFSSFSPRTLSLRFFVLFVSLVVTLRADPLTKSLEIDFGRDVASRNLKGLATRSDGRVLAGPVFTDLAGPKLGDILWTIKPRSAGKFLVGTGPDGRVEEVTFSARDNSYTTRTVADVAETQALAVQPLPDGRFLIGTSPTAAVYLAQDGKILARVPLPADSVFDFAAQPDGSVLVATGNPGKIYRLDLAQFAQGGVKEGLAAGDQALAASGVTLFGEIRDRNVRRLLRLADGRIVAGSSPRGNVYAFTPSATSPAKAEPPILLQENRDTEVVDLLPAPDGGFYAALVASPGDAERLMPKRGPVVLLPTDDKDDKEPAKSVFTGRSVVVKFPADGAPETILSRALVSFYRLAQRGDWLLVSAGEQGDVFGYDTGARRTLVFAGSSSAQLSDLVAVDPDRFLALRNNAPGLALLAFGPAATRELESKRLDLGQPGEIGNLRFSRLRGLELSALKLELRTNYGSDELEGWSPWTEMKPRDGAFYAAGARGRYVKLRLTVAGSAADFQLDKPTLFYLPQDRRPVLTDFRILPPNLGIVPAAEPPAPVATSLAQLLFPGPRDAKDEAAEAKRGKNAFLGSQVTPSPGAQVIFWTVSDPDGDALAYTFSIRPENSGAWIDLAVNTRDPFVQFETGALPEGLYLTRLTVAEQAPRPAPQRLSHTFETDALTIDRTPPAITDTSVQRLDGKLIITVSGRDALSLLDGAEFVLNNGTRDAVTHPADGIRDGREEKFIAEFPDAKASGATSVEILLYDEPGNSTSVRLPLK